MTFSVWKHLRKSVPDRLVKEKWLKLGEIDHVASDIMINGLRLEFFTTPDCTTDFPPDYLVTKGIQAERLEPFIPDWLEEEVIGRLETPEIPPLIFLGSLRSQKITAN